MAYLLGSLVGALLGMAILSAIIERFAFRNKPPLERAQFTVGLAFVIAAVISGFGAANGGPFVWDAGFKYVPGAIVVFIWYYNRYNKSWTDDGQD